jgi:hypothetical protein
MQRAVEKLAATQDYIRQLIVVRFFAVFHRTHRDGEVA